MAKKVKSAQMAAQKWTTAMGSAQTQANYSAGIDAVQSSPMAAAAAALPLYLQRVQDAVNSGRMANALNNSSFSNWKSQAKQHGAPGLKTGALKAAGKQAAAMQKLAPYWQQASDAAGGIPKGGRDASIARFTAAMDVMKSAKGATKQ